MPPKKSGPVKTPPATKKGENAETKSKGKVATASDDVQNGEADGDVKEAPKSGTKSSSAKSAANGKSTPSKDKSAKANGKKEVNGGKKDDDKIVGTEKDAQKSNKSQNKSSPAAKAKSATKETTSSTSASKKRKADSNDTDDSSRRRSRRSGAGPPSTEQLLTYLLSPAAAELCRPEDESQDISSHKSSGDYKTYSSSVLNPFEELMCAIILSRPISHRLGLRTIRTVLNKPYSFHNARAIESAGADKRRQALWDAHTQHKDKTAEQLGMLADSVLEHFTDTASDKDGSLLGKVADELEKGGKDGKDENAAFEKMRETLKAQSKGLGKTGLDIFSRRVQYHWEACYPFVDERTGDALRALGLPADGDDLVEVLDEHWKKLDTKHLDGADQATKKRRALVIILERATGADLEGKGGELLNAAHDA